METKTMKEVTLIIIAIMLTGCNIEDFNEQTEYIEIPVEAPTEQKYEYEIKLDTQPEYLTPIYTGMNANYVTYDNATTHSYITEKRLLSNYDINLNISYKYRVRMDIHLDSGYCASAWFYNDNDVTFSDENTDCRDNYPVYSLDDFMAIYGSVTVSAGVNFTVTFIRAGSVDLEWLIK